MQAVRCLPSCPLPLRRCLRGLAVLVQQRLGAGVHNCRHLRRDARDGGPQLHIAIRVVFSPHGPNAPAAAASKIASQVREYYTVRIPGWGRTVSATSGRAPCQTFIFSAHAREPASIGVLTHRHRTKENTSWRAIASHCTCGLRRAEGHASAAAWPRPKPTAALSACDPRACRHLSCQCDADWMYMHMDVTPT